METGIAQGLEQLSLSIFTTLSPVGTIAFLALTCFGFIRIEDEAEVKRFFHFLVIPLSACLIGFIASTTHLGKPSNALFVLTGVGRSPLSNEVAASVVFFGLAWIFWLAGFSDRVRSRHLRTVFPFIVATALGQLWFTSSAYSIFTISSWYLPYTQVNQIFSALLGGCFLFLFTMAVAKQPCGRRAAMTAVATSALSTVALLISELMQSTRFLGLSSTTYSLVELFPQYPGLIIASTVLLIASVLLGFIWNGKGGMLSWKQNGIILLLSFAGIFIARFSFYCAYINVGLGL